MRVEKTQLKIMRAETNSTEYNNSEVLKFKQKGRGQSFTGAILKAEKCGPNAQKA